MSLGWPWLKRDARPSVVAKSDRSTRSLTLKIRRAGVVSFDVFDTAILRPLVRPDDLFRLMQAGVAAILGAELDRFWAVRVAAEGEARGRMWEKTHATEVALNDIYRRLAGLLDIDGATAEKLSELELAAEKAVCRANPYIRTVYNQCLELRKRIVFISDTYLPETFVAELLHSNGYDAYDALFVSCTGRKTKMSGELFDEALERLAYPPRRWLHIGDNRHADIRMARKRGIATWHYERCAETFVRDRHLRAAWNSQAPLSPGGSVVLGLVINRMAHQRPVTSPLKPSQTFWADFGYRAAGPLFVGFVEWIIERTTSAGLDALYFLARDGLIIKRIYEALRPASLKRVESHYLYSSRRVMTFAAIRTLDERALAFLMQSRGVNEVGLFLDRIGLDCRAHTDAIRDAGFDDPHQKVTTEEDFERLKRLLMLLAQPICDRAAAERAVVQDYLVSSGLRSGRRVALIDVGWQCTQQQSIADMLHENGPRIMGLYLGTFGTGIHAAHLHHPRYSHDAYLFRLGQPREYAEMIAHGLLVVETLFASTEKGISGLQRGPCGQIEPVRGTDELSEDVKENIQQLQDAAMEFVEDYLVLKRVFPDLSMPKEVAIAELSRILARPTTIEAQLLGDIPFMLDFGEGTPRKIAPPLTLRMLLRSRQSRWRSRGYHVVPWYAGSYRRSSALCRRLHRMLR
jgi:predicted HAD superfamily hydrolase